MVVEGKVKRKEDVKGREFRGIEDVKGRRGGGNRG